MKQQKIIQDFNQLAISRKWQQAVRSSDGSHIEIWTLPSYSDYSDHKKIFELEFSLKKNISSVQLSSDYKKVAFCIEYSNLERITHHELYLINSDGSNLIKVAEIPMISIIGFLDNNNKLLLLGNLEQSEDFSKSVPFNRHYLYDHLYIMDLENRKIETIAENISMSYLGMKPVSPNEEEFVFETEEGEITIFNLKQHSFRKLINGVKMSLPSWSPDGQYIIFQQQGDKTKKGAAAWRGDFYIIHPDGTGKRLIMSQKEVLSPLLYARGYRVTAMIEWTPDNRYIIFSRMAGSDGESSITLVLDFKIGDIVELPSKYEIK